MLARMWNTWNSLTFVSGNVKWYNHFGMPGQYPIKLNIYLPYDLVITFLLIYQKDVKTMPSKDLYRNVSTDFVHNCLKLETPKYGKWIYKLCYIHKMKY